MWTRVTCSLRLQKYPEVSGIPVTSVMLLFEAAGFISILGPHYRSLQAGERELTVYVEMRHALYSYLLILPVETQKNREVFS